MKLITKKGETILIDKKDYSIISAYNWRLTDGYAITDIKRSNGKYTTMRMHRLLFGFPTAEFDHINLNRADNRRNNLRLATKNQNGYNRFKQSNNTSGFKGVHKLRRTGKYQTHISLDGKNLFLGTFNTKAKAALAYDMAAREYHGAFRRANFE